MRRVIFGLAGATVLVLVLALATQNAPDFSPGQKAVLNRAVTCHVKAIAAGTPLLVIGRISLDPSDVGVLILSKEPIYDGMWRDCLVPKTALTAQPRSYFISAAR